MKELTLSELKWYLQCLENTWIMYGGNVHNLAKSVEVYEHLQKRYRNIKNIIKRKDTRYGKLVGTYHIVRTECI